tara:strand:- start:444 stop:767 length:324 start_codon:yes stop_codon:yes gene_type:complete
MRRNIRKNKQKGGYEIDPCDNPVKTDSGLNVVKPPEAKSNLPQSAQAASEIEANDKANAQITDAALGNISKNERGGYRRRNRKINRSKKKIRRIGRNKKTGKKNKKG